MEVGSLKSQYLDRFRRWQEIGGIELVGNGLIVEKIETEVKTASGIIVATPSNHIQKTFTVMKPLWVRVLYTGRGYHNSDTGEDSPLTVKAGDICLVGDSAVKWVSAFGPMVNLVPETIGFTTEELVQMRFDGEEAFLKAFEVLNG